MITNLSLILFLLAFIIPALFCLVSTIKDHIRLIKYEKSIADMKANIKQLRKENNNGTTINRW